MSFVGQNACSVAATIEQACSKAATRQKSAPHVSNFTAEPANRQYGRIAENLGRGERAAMTAAELAPIFNCASRRELRRQIERERRSGALILASGRGYFLPSDDPEQARDELARFVGTAERKAISLLGTLRTARQALRQCEGQAALSEVTGGAET